MEVLEAIRGRRSVRSFRQEPVPERILNEILEAGVWAPSAGNMQCRKFIIVRGKAKERLARMDLRGRFQFAGEPVSIVVCADERIAERYAERGVELYNKLDCAAAIENMMLAAYSHGLGTCWIGAFDERLVSEALGLPGHLRPLTIMALGYPKDVFPPAPQRKSVREACEFLE